MTRKTSPWLDPTPAPDVTRMEQRDLLLLWASNRNSLLGAMAAEEMMKRLYSQMETSNVG